LKEELHGQRDCDNKTVINAVKQWTTLAVADFYRRGIHAVVHHWQKCIKNGGNFKDK